MSERLKVVAENENDSDGSWESFVDDYLDENIDLEKAITKTMHQESKTRVVNAEWSGQDIIPAFDPYKAGIAIDNLSNVRVYRRGFLQSVSKSRQYLQSLIISTFFENIMTL